jgi:hypothetical protein
MIREFAHFLRPTRLRTAAIAVLGVLIGAACDHTDPLASSGPSEPPAAAAAPDSVTATDSPAPALSLYGSVGRPYGAYGLLASGTSPGPLNLSNAAPSPSSIVNLLNTARANRMRLVLALTGGPHTAVNRGCCLSVINGVVQFDRRKWDAVMAKFNTATIRNAVAQAVADGTVIGATVMDEPYTSGTGNKNTWGPPGTMSKLKVDGLCGAVQKIFPTLPAGVQHPPLDWERDKSYKVCQFIWGGVGGTTLSEFLANKNAALALGARDHHAILFNMNVINGGRKDTDGNYNCTGTDQAGKGNWYPLCRMTAARVRERGLVLGTAGCALTMWTHNSTFWSRTDNTAAFKDVAAKAATAPAKACRRS